MEIKLLQNVEGPYVEFTVSGSATEYAAGAADAIFLDNYVFGIFAGSFAAAHDQFDLHGATAFAGDQLARLQDALQAHWDQLAKIKDDASFLSTIEAFSGHYFLQMLEYEHRDYRFEWPLLWLNLLSVSAGLRDLVGQCAGKGQVLWVLGL